MKVHQAMLTVRNCKFYRDFIVTVGQIYEFPRPSESMQSPLVTWLGLPSTKHGETRKPVMLYS